MSDLSKYTLEDFKEMNKRMEEVGMNASKFIIDEENGIVYKDDIHKLLGIGYKIGS